VNQMLEVNKERFVRDIESVALILTEFVSLPGEGEKVECVFCLKGFIKRKE
jgi:hypothetical protein